MRFFGVKFDKHTTLEAFLMSATKPHGVGGTVIREERFYVELSARDLFAEALGIDAACHGFVLVDLLDFVHGLVSKTFAEGHFALHAAIIVDKIKDFTVTKSSNNSAKRLKMAHTLEGMDDAKGNGKVCMALHLGEEESVNKEVGIRKIKLYLAIGSVVALIDIVNGQKRLTCLRISTGSSLSAWDVRSDLIFFL